MPAAHVLLLDPDSARCEDLVRLLRGSGHHPVVVSDAAAAARALAVPGLGLAVLALGDGAVQAAALRHALAPEQPVSPDSLEAAERRHIMLALEHTRGNKRRAAHVLGIARSTLLAKIRRYGLQLEVKSEA
jgi:DNA-binding NtrC family response regulator